MAAEKKSGRIDLLDAWRSSAFVCMVIYHFCYDLCLFGWMAWDTFFTPGMNLLQRYICCSFILLAGISARFSRSSLRHGAVVFGASILVSIGGAVVGEPILFGILQFLGVSLMLYGLIGPFLEKRTGSVVFPIVYFALLWLTAWWTENTLVGVHWLFPLGFRYAGFYSSDYFPLLPWFFLFLIGTWAGGRLKERQDSWPPILRRRLPAAVTWPGRHSLILYLLHQPVLYGICWGISLLYKS